MKPQLNSSHPIPALQISSPAGPSTPNSIANDAIPSPGASGPGYPQGGANTMQFMLRKALSNVWSKTGKANPPGSNQAEPASTEEALRRHAIDLDKTEVVEIVHGAVMSRELASLKSFKIDTKGMKDYANEFNKKIPNKKDLLVETANGTSNTVKFLLRQNGKSLPLHELTLESILKNHKEQFDEKKVGYLLNMIAGNTAYHKVLLELGYQPKDDYIFKERLSLIDLDENISDQEREIRKNSLEAELSKQFEGKLQTIRKNVAWLEARLEYAPMKEVKEYYDGFLETLRNANAGALASATGAPSSTVGN